MSIGSVITSGFGTPGSKSLVITFGYGQSGVTPPPPITPQTGAGSRRRKHTRYVARHKGEDYEFSTLRELQEFVYQAKQEVRRSPSVKKVPKIVINIAPEYMEEVSEAFKASDISIPPIISQNTRQAVDTLKKIEAQMRLWQQDIDDEDEEILKIIYDA